MGKDIQEIVQSRAKAENTDTETINMRNGARGGKASGQARRQMKSAKETARMLLSLSVETMSTPHLSDIIDNMPENESDTLTLMLASLLKKAVYEADTKSIELMLKIAKTETIDDPFHIDWGL